MRKFAKSSGKKVSLVLDEETIAVIDKIKALGTRRAHKLKAIILSWLTEHNYMEGM